MSPLFVTSSIIVVKIHISIQCRNGEMDVKHSEQSGRSLIQVYCFLLCCICRDHASGTVGIGAEEPYCDILEGCSLTGFAGEACRPPQCPFTTPEGCERVRTCLRSGVMELYEQMLAPEVSVPTKVPASGAGANPDGASDME